MGKPVKKAIPYWATLSEKEAAKMTSAKKSGLTGSTGISVITDAIKDCADSKGLASYILIKKHVLKHHPSWPKMVFKSSLRRAIQKGLVKQIRNSYKVMPANTTIKTVK